MNARILSKDSVLLEIENVSDTDTVYFSLYKQHLFGRKWVTANYDIFCDIGNPKTTILAISPCETIPVPVAIGGSMISVDVPIKRKTKKSDLSFFYRYMFYATEEMNKYEFKCYSNILGKK